MKKVLFVATVVKTHIMEFHVPYLEMFQQMGWETAVAARNDYRNPADCAIPFCHHYYDIPFHRSPLKKNNLSAYRQLRRLIRQEHYDIIHCHTPVGAMIARLAAMGQRKHGTKVIYTAHGFHFFRGAPLKNWLLYFPAEWLLAHFTDVLITINREDHAFAQKHLHAGRVEYVPGVGVDTHKFRFDPQARNNKRQELGIGKEDFLILTVAELIARKNHSLVLEALHLLRREPFFPKVRYLICGQGELEEALREQCRRLEIDSQVIFAGYRRDIPELCSAADLFAFMTHQEGLPVALMEAMSCSLPCLCSRVRGCSDLITDGTDGRMTQMDPQAVADAIAALYRDPALRTRLGRAAAGKLQEFSSESVHKKMLEIYRSV